MTTFCCPKMSMLAALGISHDWVGSRVKLKSKTTTYCRWARRYIIPFALEIFRLPGKLATSRLQETVTSNLFKWKNMAYDLHCTNGVKYVRNWAQQPNKPCSITTIISRHWRLFEYFLTFLPYIFRILKKFL